MTTKVGTVQFILISILILTANFMGEHFARAYQRPELSRSSVLIEMCRQYFSLRVTECADSHGLLGLCIKLRY